MLSNRSIPSVTVIPELSYPDITEAAKWLCDVFGFTLRIRIGDHRIQLNVLPDGAVVLRQTAATSGDSLLIRVADVDAHHKRSSERGARILMVPSDQPFGERQYSVEDFAGRGWTFSQSIADVDPHDWGGETS